MPTKKEKPRQSHGTQEKKYFPEKGAFPEKLTDGYMLSISCEMLGWMKHSLESRLPGEISITSDMPYGRKGRGTKKPLDERERGE